MGPSRRHTTLFEVSTELLVNMTLRGSAWSIGRSLLQDDVREVRFWLCGIAVGPGCFFAPYEIVREKNCKAKEAVNQVCPSAEGKWKERDILARSIATGKPLWRPRNIFNVANKGISLGLYAS